jgi:general secretion pathway protein N
MRIPARIPASIMPALAIFVAHAAVGAAVEPAVDPSAGGASIAGAPADEQLLPVRTSPAPPTRGNPLWAVPLADLSATRERPIFSPLRRPPTPPAVAAAIEPAPPVPPKPQRPPLTLVGTIVGETTQIGVFVEENTHQMVRLPVGAGHEGWILRLVSAQGVRLERQDQAVMLTLRPADLMPATDVEEASAAEAIPAVRHRRR